VTTARTAQNPKTAATHATAVSAPEKDAIATAAQVTTAVKLPAMDVSIVLQDVTHASAQWTNARKYAKNATTAERASPGVTHVSVESAPETAVTVIAARRTPVARLLVKDARTVLKAVSLASAP